MLHKLLYDQENDNRLRIIRVIVGIVCGALLAWGIYWVTTLEGRRLFLVVGALLGGVIGFYLQTFFTLWRRFWSEDWKITEIEIDTLGQKWKLANSGSQRRVAWSLFVEITTRVATQTMTDEEGDDGVVLKSLYDLFQFTRKSITDMQSTDVLPSRHEELDTVETYALFMLNQDIRPFLSKWHPIWDSWRPSNQHHPCSDWEHHLAFREDLRQLQAKIYTRAEGLARIAGVSNVNRFVNIPVQTTQAGVGLQHE